MTSTTPTPIPDASRRHWLASALAAPSLGLMGCSSLGSTPSNMAASTNSPAAFGHAWHMPGVRYIDLPAARLPGSTTERQHRVMVYVPQGPAPAQGWPVIYVLDGNLMFPLLAQLMHNRGGRGAEMRGASAVIVGLGHALPAGSIEVHDRAARTYDYTLPFEGVGPDSQGRAQGGADVFLDWMAQQLQPMLHTQLPLHAQQQTLVGHSYGGLFTLHTLFTRPAMFQQYVAASPSLWWGNGIVLEEAVQFMQRYQSGSTPLPTAMRLYLSQGSEEIAGRTDPRRTPNPEREASARQAQARARTHGLTNAAALAQALRQVPQLHTEHDIWPGANHGGTQLYACMQAARVGVDWSRSEATVATPRPAS